MGSYAKLGVIVFLAMYSSMNEARPLESKSGPTSSCWDSLFELQSCTGEVIQFFYNGESNLGPDCCQAIYVIGHNCWPAMLDSLGFTPRETALLQGYCDALKDSATPPLALSPSPSRADQTDPSPSPY